GWLAAARRGGGGSPADVAEARELRDGFVGAASGRLRHTCVLLQPCKADVEIRPPGSVGQQTRGFAGIAREIVELRGWRGDVFELSAAERVEAAPPEDAWILGLGVEIRLCGFGSPGERGGKISAVD